MSNWTHVAGVIRIDDLRFDESILDFDKLIGKECLFDDDNGVWEDAEINPDSYLPMGWEGTLQKSVWVNPDRSCAAAYVVTIFGDLRDHHDPNEIIEWFKNKIKEIHKDYWVRDATITARNECNGTVNWTFENNDD